MIVTNRQLTDAVMSSQAYYIPYPGKAYIDQEGIETRTAGI
nr:MAG TPA: hypothetical protein [Caudoviricetes sp.]